MILVIFSNQNKTLRSFCILLTCFTDDGDFFYRTDRYVLISRLSTNANASIFLSTRQSLHVTDSFSKLWRIA